MPRVQQDTGADGPVLGAASYILVAGSYDGAVFSFLVTPGKGKGLADVEIVPHMHMQEHTGVVTSLAYTPRRQLLVSGGNDMGIRVYNARTRRAVGFLNEHNGPVSCLAFAGEYMLSAGGDARVCLYDTKEYETLFAMKGHKQAVGSSMCDICSIAVHPSARMAFTACTTDNSVRLWDLGEGSCVYTVRLTQSASTGAPRRILGMAMRDNIMLLWGEKIVSLHSMDKSDVRLPNSSFDIEAAAGSAGEQQAITTERISAACFVRDSSHVLVGTNHGNVYALHIAVKSEGPEEDWPATVLGHWRVSESVAPSMSSSYVCRVKGISELVSRGDDSLVALALSDGELAVWRLTLGSPRLDFHKLRAVFTQSRLTAFCAAKCL